MKSLIVLLSLIGFSNFSEGALYKNTVEDKIKLKEFVENQKGILICEAISGYIYGKGITTWIKGDEKQSLFILSAYNNEAQKWVEQNVKMTLFQHHLVELDGYIQFKDSDAHIFFEIGMGKHRDLVSDLGAWQTSESFPYSGSTASYQFHNICRIEL